MPATSRFSPDPRGHRRCLAVKGSKGFTRNQLLWVVGNGRLSFSSNKCKEADTTRRAVLPAGSNRSRAVGRPPSDQGAVKPRDKSVASRGHAPAKATANPGRTKPAETSQRNRWLVPRTTTRRKDHPACGPDFGAAHGDGAELLQILVARLELDLLPRGRSTGGRPMEAGRGDSADHVAPPAFHSVLVIAEPESVGALGLGGVQRTRMLGEVLPHPLERPTSGSGKSACPLRQRCGGGTPPSRSPRLPRPTSRCRCTTARGRIATSTKATCPRNVAGT